jgi:hypothetical protein
MTFMVKGTRQHALNAELLVLLAAEHACVHELREPGSIDPLDVVADQSRAWLVMQGDS